MKVPITKIELDNKTIAAANRALKSGNWVLGEENRKFEREFAKFCDVKYAVSVSSGTTALFLALKALGVKTGDEVIVPSFSFIATASTVSMCGAVPKFADINKEDFTIDSESIKEKITKKTVGIVPVHLFGHSADLNPIKKIAKKHSLFVLEDAAQAHGTTYRGRKTGSLGDAACFSFYPSKNLTVCGDGGMITSNDKKLIKQVILLRDHGRIKQYEHAITGYNFRMSEMNAAMGRVRLKKLEDNNKQRQKIAKKYDQSLENVVKPIKRSWSNHVYHQYSILTKNREQLLKFLSSVGIGAGIYYPIPIHKQAVYRKSKEKLPVTESVAKQILSLPMFPTMTEKEQNYVIRNLNKFFK